ncbi:Scr1 family TA system antitoxin-like transcriptional regulator [Streptomyces sp. NPDC001904]|uniref:Scr1 family TA system antitoxin-like transcriptional regulator n=1 Tax=Streptomyces sp. NPDC001904 TaxID=3154531 RepID=UPI003322B8BE
MLTSTDSTATSAIDPAGMNHFGDARLHTWTLRLMALIGLDTTDLGVIPPAATLKIPPTVPFWVHDERLVMVETWHAERWIDDADAIALHLRIWRTLRESAVYGADAQELISRARCTLHAG